MASRRLLVLSALILIFLIGIGSHLPSAGWQAVSWPGRGIANLAQVLGDVGGFHRLRAERDALRADVARLSQELTDAREATQENRRLRSLIELSSAAPSSMTVARVIGRSPWLWSQSIVLDQGRRQGIHPDAPVVVPDGLVGRVAEVGERTARAVLLTDPNFRAGVILERTRQEGLLTGTPDGRCEITYLPIEADIQPHDVVLTAGIGVIFPKGLRVGEVTSIREDPSRSYRIAAVRPYAALSNLEEVGCLLAQ
ncbi:MAG: rod shape-determining protein MreC [Candidatus Omnitrophica bacterium]|nr:rod shape-determining protein MreC [Candidatus Omnitrophota bacterium]